MTLVVAVDRLAGKKISIFCCASVPYETLGMFFSAMVVVPPPTVSLLLHEANVEVMTKANSRCCIFIINIFLSERKDKKKSVKVKQINPPQSNLNLFFLFRKYFEQKRQGYSQSYIELTSLHQSIQF